MNITKLVITAVDSTACLSSEKLSLRLASAMTMAPLAPIAPPSVGVATPRKIVPSTRKISTSGGIIDVNTLTHQRAAEERARLRRAGRRGRRA